MSLFSTHSITEKKEKPKEAFALKNKARIRSRVLGKNLRQLEETIGQLEKETVIQFCTGGKWSMHELIRYILMATGPSKVWMTTWTITEEPMRALLDLIKDGQVTELAAVLDYRIERRKPEAFQLASNIITRIKLTKCHAKVAVIKNDDWSVTVLGSANFSKNPRIEAGVIFTDKESADFHIQWIDDVIDGKEVFSAK